MNASHPLLHATDRPVLLPGGPATRQHRIAPSAPAVSIMTDFRSAPVVTTAFDTSIHDALEQMKLSGARYAFVTGAGGELAGAVTSYDIQGERPVQYMVSVGCSETTCAWRDVQVENIMTPVAEWQVLELGVAQAMTIAQLAELFVQRQLRYLVVVEDAAGAGSWQVRGLFSAARLQLLAGAAVTAPEAEAVAA
jgi:CBS-domain-containing membrane protein